MKGGWAIAAVAAMIGNSGVAQTPPRAQPQPPAKVQSPKVPTRINAQTLTRLCGEDRSACLTYVLGASDAFAAALAAAGRPQVFCIPRGTTNDDIAKAVVAYLRAHPTEGQTNAALVILAGLTATYRCGY